MNSDVAIRIRSILLDSSTFLNEVVSFFHEKSKGKYSIVSNDRCGAWYGFPYSTHNNVHFKSTDGHKNIYNFSLKRLHLDFLRTIAKASKKDGAVLVVDASKYKTYCDSFKATLPVWCAVMNKLILHYRSNIDANFNFEEHEEVELFTPPTTSEEEHMNMKGVIEDRFQNAVDAKVVLNPKEFVRNSPSKPMRCFWIVQNSKEDTMTKLNELSDEIDKAKSEYSCIVCVSCSDRDKGLTNDNYISGAGDDEESWAHGLTPYLLWKNIDHFSAFDEPYDAAREEEIMSTIQHTVNEAKSENEEYFRANHSRCKLYQAQAPFTSYFNTMTITDFSENNNKATISIGSRRSGRPNTAWKHFDAIVNVTTMEYEEFSSMNGIIPTGKFYIQLPVKEGKRDKTELEKWMSTALLFIMVHLKENRRVLIHCAQGMDRSVAICMAVLCLCCEFDRDDGSIVLKSWVKEVSYQNLYTYFQHENKIQEGDPCFTQVYKHSSIPSVLVKHLCSKDGKNIFFSYVQMIINENTSRDRMVESDIPFATKESLRQALLKIHEFRSSACPTRSTMQKLNRYFMSGEFEPALRQSEER